MENSGNSVQPRGKIVTKKVVFVCRLNVCLKQLLTGNGIIIAGVDVERPLVKVVIAFTFCCDDL